MKYFKVGQTVYSTQGKGIVENIIDNKLYPVIVRWGNGNRDGYTNDGRFSINDLEPSLFQNPVITQPNIPLCEFKQGDLVLVSDDGTTWFVQFFVSQNSKGHFEATTKQNSTKVYCSYKYCKKYTV
jgi:hypothetical protein